MCLPLYVHVGQNVPKPPGANGSNSLLAKYSYKAHPDQPGGFAELTIKQGAKLQFLNVHPEQPLWWNVKEQGGSSGYVPASYMMVSFFLYFSVPFCLLMSRSKYHQFVLVFTGHG